MNRKKWTKSTEKKCAYSKKKYSNKYLILITEKCDVQNKEIIYWQQYLIVKLIAGTFYRLSNILKINKNALKI